MLGYFIGYINAIGIKHAAKASLIYMSECW